MALVAQTMDPHQRTPWLRRLYLWACRRLYNELAWTYDGVSWLVSLGRWATWRRVALDYVDGPRVLEVGFGTGDLLAEMAGRNWQVYGLEISPAMQRIAAHKLQARGLQVPRVRGAVQAMPFADNAFDAIVATFPAEFILDPAAQHEFARLLRRPDPATGRPGGRLIVVGLRVVVDNPLVRSGLNLLYGASLEQMLAHYGRIAAAAGLDVTVHTQGDGPVDVSVILAEKRESL